MFTVILYTVFVGLVVTFREFDKAFIIIKNSLQKRLAKLLNFYSFRLGYLVKEEC